MMMAGLRDPLTILGCRKLARRVEMAADQCPVCACSCLQLSSEVGRLIDHGSAIDDVNQACRNSRFMGAGDQPDRHEHGLARPSGYRSRAGINVPVRNAVRKAVLPGKASIAGEGKKCVIESKNSIGAPQLDRQTTTTTSSNHVLDRPSQRSI